jgi:copper chaperone CopZ
MAIEKINIQINGMTCGHCQKSVLKIISDSEGVLSADVDLAKGIATITIDNTKTAKEKLVKAINESEIYSAK